MVIDVMANPIKQITGYNGPPVARNLYENRDVYFNVLCYESIVQYLT